MSTTARAVAPVFGQPEHAAPLLRSCLPLELAQAIDWSTLRREPEVQVDERQRRQELDLLFSAQHGARRALIYALVEHSSGSPPLMPLKMLMYVGGVLRDHARRHGDGPLPVVIPIVIHCGKGPWRAPVEMLDLFDLQDLDDATAAQATVVLPHFRYFVDDIWRCSEQDLRARALSLLGLVTVAAQQYLAPVHGDPDEVAQWFVRWGDTVTTALVAATTPSTQDAVAAVISYILRVTRLGRSRLELILLEHTDEPTMKKFVSTYDLAIREGKTAGRVEGQAHVLLRQLQRRFGEVPESIRDHLGRATQAQLDRWADRVLDAPTIGDVFAG